MTDKKTEDILIARKGSHGEYMEHADISQGILEECMRGRNWTSLPRPMRESLHMFAHKMARVVTGNPYHEDHWDDISGYAVLISQRMDRLKPKTGPAQMHIDYTGGGGPGAADPLPERSELSPAADSGAAGIAPAPGAAQPSETLANGSEPEHPTDHINDIVIEAAPMDIDLRDIEEWVPPVVPHPSPVLQLSHERQPRDATDAEYQSFANQLVPAGKMKGSRWLEIYEQSPAEDGRWKMFPIYHEEYGS